MASIRFFAMDVVFAESRARDEATFARLHPTLVLAIDPFVRGAPGSFEGRTATKAIPAWKRGEPDVAQMDRLHPKGRVCWAPEGQTEIKIGRSPTCDVLLPHGRISKEHARLRGEPIPNTTTLRWFVQDLGSKNGTTLNDTRLAPNEEKEIFDGERVMLGGVALVRPFVSPFIFHRALREADPGPPKEAAHVVDIGLLAEIVHGLGSDSDLAGVDLRVRGSDGITVVSVQTENDSLVVSWRTGSSYLERRAVPLGDPQVGEAIREFVTEALLAASSSARKAPRERAPAPDPLAETHTDDWPKRPIEDL